MSGLATEIAKVARTWSGVRAEHIEMMAAAFALKTGLPPDRVTLVEKREKDGTIRWWYEERQPTDVIRYE